MPRYADPIDLDFNRYDEECQAAEDKAEWIENRAKEIRDEMLDDGYKTIHGFKVRWFDYKLCDEKDLMEEVNRYAAEEAEENEHN